MKIEHQTFDHGHDWQGNELLSTDHARDGFKMEKILLPGAITAVIRPVMDDLFSTSFFNKIKSLVLHKSLL